MSQEVLEKLHNEFLGAQDKGVDVPEEYAWKHDGVVKESHSFTIHNPSRYFRHFLTSETNNPNIAFANFRIGPASALESVRLTFGDDHEIERLYMFKHLNKDPQFYQMSEGRAIPALKQRHRVFVETNQTGPITISYDIVSGIPSDRGCCENSILQEQFTGTEELGEGTDNKFRLNWNHPVVKVYAFIDAPDVIDARIILNGVDHGLVLQKEGDHWVFDFGHATSLNFSRVDNPILHVKTIRPHSGAKVNLFAISKQVVRRWMTEGTSIAGYYS